MENLTNLETMPIRTRQRLQSYTWFNRLRSMKNEEKFVKWRETPILAASRKKSCKRWTAFEKKSLTILNDAATHERARVC
jgi:hypothetical protein